MGDISSLEVPSHVHKAHLRPAALPEGRQDKFRNGVIVRSIGLAGLQEGMV